MHEIRPLAYLRYGDDWLCFANSLADMRQIQAQSKLFLGTKLSLTINPKIDEIRPVYKGVSYLGVDIWPSGRRLQPAVSSRINQRLSQNNAASYRAIVLAHQKAAKLRTLDWRLLDMKL